MTRPRPPRRTCSSPRRSRWSGRRSRPETFARALSTAARSRLGCGHLRRRRATAARADRPQGSPEGDLLFLQRDLAVECHPLGLAGDGVIPGPDRIAAVLDVVKLPFVLVPDDDRVQKAFCDPFLAA